MEFLNKIFAKAVDTTSHTVGEWYLKIRTDGELVKSEFVEENDFIRTTVDTQAKIGEKYLIDSPIRIVVTLPLGNVRKTVRIAGFGSGGWRLRVTPGVTLKFGEFNIPNFIESTHPNDAIEILCVSNNLYHAISCIGNLRFD